MKKLYAILGITLTLLPSSMDAASLYGQIADMVMHQESQDDSIISFVAKAVSKKEGKDVSEGDVRSVFNPYPCDASSSLSQHFHLDPLNCQGLVQEIKDIMQREQDVQNLGHDLQAIATSYELPITLFSQDKKSFVATYQNILDIWGIKNLTNDAQDSVRILPVPTDKEKDVNKKVNELSSALNQLKPELRVAAITRYQYGLNFVQKKSPSENPDGQSGPKTERQYLFLRFDGRSNDPHSQSEPDIEEKLGNLRDALPHTFDPPLRKGQTALFLLPDAGTDVGAWVSVLMGSGSITTVDVGLQWKLALTPVMPSLLTKDKDMILGGTYPPLPVTNSDKEKLQKGGAGLCDSVIGKQGYLCRIPTRVQEAGCADVKPQSNIIQLTTCPVDPKKKEEDDMCADMPWNISSTESDICNPDSSVTYPHTVLGNTCFIRECAKRSYNHDVFPKENPLVSQESAAQWDACLALPAPKTTLTVPPSIVTEPSFPEYNPGESLRQFNIQYCQVNGRSPQQFPILCDLDLADVLQRLQSDNLSNGLKLLDENGNGKSPQKILLDGAEAMGAEVAADIYKQYLLQASMALNGTLGSTVTILQDMAKGTFPTVMCSLNSKDIPTMCQ